MDNNIIDEETALKQIGDRDFYYELIDEFIDTVQEKLNELDMAITKDNYDTIIREAHSLKGVAANLYLENMRTSSLHLEDAARQGRKEDFEQLNSKLKTAYKKLLDYKKNMGRFNNIEG